MLCERIRELRVDLDAWWRLQPMRAVKSPEEQPLLDLAMADLFFNRTNLSGIIGARPIGGFGQRSAYAIDCRFPKETLIERICSLRQVMTKVKVLHGDGISYLQGARRRLEKNGIPAYIDPPYHGQGRRLYRYHFKDGTHQRLARHLDSANYPWLVSYDNTPFIRRLFENQKIVPIELRYAVREARRTDELLITNQPNLPVANVQDTGQGVGSRLVA